MWRLGRGVMAASGGVIYLQGRRRCGDCCTLLANIVLQDGVDDFGGGSYPPTKSIMFEGSIIC